MGQDGAPFVQVFKLEEQREKSLDRLVTVIQRCWRSFAARKWYLELRATTHDAFYGKKQRRQYSINRKFSGDQLMLKFNKTVQTLLHKEGTPYTHPLERKALAGAKSGFGPRYMQATRPRSPLPTMSSS